MIIPAESKCTIYHSNGEDGYDRYVISACHFQENRAANVLKSGLQNVDGVTVYIPAEQCESLPELGGAQDIIAPGECDFEFDNTSPKTVSDSLKELKQSYKVYAVMSIDKKLYGLPALRHIKISAK